MKKIIFLIAITFLGATVSPAQGILDKIKMKTKQRADAKVDKTIDKGLDKVEDAGKGNNNKADNSNNTNDQKQSANSSSAPSLKVYQNYDFVPGDKILFEDNFIDDQDGEFPAHWELIAGQAVANKIKGELALFLTEGNYVRVKPRMKTESYLTDPFTVEYDMYSVPGAYGVITMLKFKNKDESESESSVGVDPSEVSYVGRPNEVEVRFEKTLSEGVGGENFYNKWHHVAIAYKNKQLKIYVDQNRILVVPDTKVNFERAEFAGIGETDHPLIFKNVRIAAGGDMNMIGKKFTESKIVTHGINFDIDKATIKPESMGTLNMIVQVLKDNPDIKFEVDGHTDNSGTAAHNLTLSQQRADAVKDQLVKMSIDASRLSAKGFGDSKPISDNTSLEGKANNRRVEFVKM